MSWIIRAFIAVVALGVPGTRARASEPGASRFVFINGGSTSDSNNDIYEKRYLSFLRTLKPVDPLFFNGAGPQTPVVRYDSTGSLQRAADGSADWSPTLLTESLPATPRSIEQEFAKLALQKPASLSIVWSDHGAPDGPSVWEDGVDYNVLTVAEIRKLYARLPATTPIRSFHQHCYAEAAIVDPLRVIPKDPNRLAAFVNQHYPQNRCALAKSAVNEVSWSHLQQTPETTEYYRWLAKNPRMSLDELKQSLGELANNVSTPNLTSDLLLKDVAAFLCAPAIPARAPLPRSENCASCASIRAPAVAAQGVSPLAASARDLLCRSEAAQSVKTTAARLAEVSDLKDEISAVRAVWLDEFAKKSDPVRFAAFARAKAAYDRKRAYALIDNPLPEPLRRELSRFNEQELAPFQRWLDVLYGSPEFLADYSERCAAAWIVARPRTYPKLAKHFAGDGAAKCREVGKRFRAEYEAAQVAQKRAVLEAQAHRTQLLSEWLAQPGQASIRARFEELRACERAPFYDTAPVIPLAPAKEGA